MNCVRADFFCTGHLGLFGFKQLLGPRSIPLENDIEDPLEHIKEDEACKTGNSKSTFTKP